ncbi:MAG: hypothetical protein F6K48_33890 [Okeania sp. SIO3H1]|nr:hypothetical protein [Okeania sp. SIO3H1]
MLKKSFSRGRRQPTPRPSPDRGGEDNPPLTPPRRGEIGMSDEVGAGVLSQDCSAQLCA